jgi:hypothetical protein
MSLEASAVGSQRVLTPKLLIIEQCKLPTLFQSIL